MSARGTHHGPAHRDAGSGGGCYRSAGGGWRRARATGARCARSAAPGPADGAPHQRADRSHDAAREARPADAPLGRADEGAPGGGAQAGRRRLQRDRPGADQQVPARRGRELAAAHPDPLRLRHDPRLPDDLPDPAGHGEQLRSGRRAGRSPHRRVRVRGGRAQADLQPDGRRLARAALGPDLRGCRRGPVPQLRDGGRARARRAGQRLQRARTRSSRASSTTSPTASRGRARLQHDRHVAQRLWNFYLPPFKAAVDAGADTAMCAFNALNGVPACAEQVHRDPDPQAAMGLRRLHRERLHRRRGAAAMPWCEPRGRPVRPRRGRGRSRRRAPGAQRRHGLRDGVDELPRLRAAARAKRPRVDPPHQRRGAPHPPREVPRGPVRAPVRGRRQRGEQAAPAAEPGRGADGRAALAGALEERRAHAAARPDQVHRADRAAGDDRHDMLGPWWGRGDDKDAVSLFEGMQEQGAVDLHAGLHDVAQRPLRPGERVRDRRRAAGRRGGRDRRPTRSCSPSARRAR